MGTGFLKKKKQAREMQQQIMQLQDRMKNVEAVGTAGNGLVTLTLTTSEIKDLKIKPECVDPEDVEGLQDLIKAAYKDAAAKLDSETKPRLPNNLAQGLPPGLF